MRVGDEKAVAAAVASARRRRGLSQAGLAEAARISAKTVQRLEGGQAVAGSSRRAVLQALGLGPGDFEAPRVPEVPEDSWAVVEDAVELLGLLATCESLEVELDRDGWRRQRRRRPWYRQDLVFASEDPADDLLAAVDRARQLGNLPPGQRAKLREELSQALKAARVLGWGLASRLDPMGRLSLYLGSPERAAGEEPET